MMDRSRDADDKVNKASKAAKFVKKGAKGKLLKKRFSRDVSQVRERDARDDRTRPDLTPTRRERDG